MSLVEVVVAMSILAVFFIPLVQQFVRVHQFTLASRDVVLVTSFQSSCLAELETLEFDELKDPGASLTAIMDRYAGPRTWEQLEHPGSASGPGVLARYSGQQTLNQLDLETSIEISQGSLPNTACIDIRTWFSLPGQKDSNRNREIALRHHVSARP